MTPLIVFGLVLCAPLACGHPYSSGPMIPPQLLHRANQLCREPYGELGVLGLRRQ